MIRISNPSHIESDELGYVFPSLGSLVPNGNTWRGVVSGMVFRDGRLTFAKKFMLGLLRRAMRAERAELETDLFRQRIRGFLAEAARGKRISVRIGSILHPLAQPTKRSGFFHEEVTLQPHELGVHHEEAREKPVILPVSMVASDGSTIGCVGQMLVLPRRGISVVSDIDDTLKETAVHDRRAMLANTFLREFSPVAGMAELYANWSQQGAAFHYVSSSPWQLFEPLQSYFQAANLPQGSMHLRSFRLQDHMLRRLFFGRKPVKGGVIRGILQRFPLRQFVFVGDSSEFDPEIYGSLARKFPTQIQGVYIRRVPGAKNAITRFEKAFRRVPTNLWQTFEHPSELPNPTERWGS
jgi:hypothetical protein